MDQVGVDYADQAEVENYDQRHQKFRDYKETVRETLGLLKLDSKSTVIDLGCGTGAFSVTAAPKLKKIFAVDVSAAMLEYSQGKAESAGLNNIEFKRGGFLTYEHEA